MHGMQWVEQEKIQIIRYIPMKTENIQSRVSDNHVLHPIRMTIHDYTHSYKYQTVS
jgi:hypothetical protein